MPFHYGARDGETEAAVLAEFLIIRPDTVETAKDRLALGFGDARTFILNADEHIVVNARGDDLDQTAGGEKETALSTRFSMKRSSLCSSPIKNATPRLGRAKAMRITWGNRKSQRL